MTSSRVTLLTENDRPDLSALTGRIRGARRGSLLNIYRALLHSPAVAESWFDHLNAVRWKTTLTGRLRELVIIRMGYLASSNYILRQHVPSLAEQEGLSIEACHALGQWEQSDAFSPDERNALAYTDAMTRSIAVDDAVFAGLQQHFTEQQIVELTVLIATYNMHARVLMALRVDLEPKDGGEQQPK